MTQVYNQTDLENALLAGETEIQVVANFQINSLVTIRSDTTISSAPGNPYILGRAAGYDNSLFQVAGGIATFSNIVIDGAKRNHPNTSGALIWVPGGGLILENGAVLQNNGAGAIRRNESSQYDIIIRENAIIQNNETSSDGGAIHAYLADGVKLEISGNALIENNSAARRGGGIYYYTTGGQQIGQLIISENAVIRNNVATENGGGIYADHGYCNMSDNVVVSYNQAVDGAGVYYDGLHLGISDNVDIHYNTAEGQGGGIYLSFQFPSYTAIHGSFLGNTADAGGGINLAVPSFGTVVDLSRSRVVKNISNNTGGGLNIVGESTSTDRLDLSMNEIVFQGNQSIGDGSAVCINYAGTLGFQSTSANITFEDNVASAGRGGLFLSVSSPSLLQLVDSSFNYNKAESGGAFYLANQSDVPLDIHLTNNVFTGNTATSSSGGAIVLGEGDIIMFMNIITMSNNTAETTGGAISIENNTGLVIIMGLGGSISFNSAANGGGIYHGNQTTLELYNIMFAQNTATGNGQDIYNIAPLYLGGRFTSSSGLFFNSYDSAPSISQNLLEFSDVQLESSDYVKPNAEGTPIVIANSITRLIETDASAFHAPPIAGFAGWGPQLSENRRQILLAPLDYELQYENTMGASNPNPSTYTVLTPTITLLPLASTSGYRFLGWFNALEGGVPATEIPLGSIGNIALYARWQYFVHALVYYGNDSGDLSTQQIPTPTEIVEGESVTLSNAIPTRKGFRFSGWNSNSSGTGTAYYPGDTIPIIQADIELYAQWIPLPLPACYTITYYGNDVGCSPAYCIPCPQKVCPDGCTRISCQHPSRNCYRFMGWNASPYGTGRMYLPGQLIGPVAEDIYLFAQWKRVPPCQSTNSISYHEA